MSEDELLSAIAEADSNIKAYQLQMAENRKLFFEIETELIGEKIAKEKFQELLRLTRARKGL